MSQCKNIPAFCECGNKVEVLQASAYQCKRCANIGKVWQTTCGQTGKRYGQTFSISPKIKIP